LTTDLILGGLGAGKSVAPKPAVCEAIKPDSVYPWRCQLRAGHDPADSHRWPIESEHYDMPLDGRSAEWLASELRMQLANVAHLRAEQRAFQMSTSRRFERLIAGLVNLAPGNSKRKNVPTEAVQELWQQAING
jgi:hypothetical protein